MKRYPWRTATTALVLVVVAALGVGSAGAAGRTEPDWVSATLRQLTLEEKVGQLFVTDVHGTDADTVSAEDAAANRALYGVDTPAQVVAKYRLGGVIYFGRNLAQPRQVAVLSNGLQRAALGAPARVPLLVSTDQESGSLVRRLGPPATVFAGSMALGAGRSTRDAYDAAAITGRELRAVGINQNFSPVADVNVDPQNPVIGVRSYGSDVDLVSRLTAAQTLGLEHGGDVIAAAKHFPGHGDTKEDSHFSIPEIDHTEEEWRRIDAPPFRAAIAVGIDVIMTAHIMVPSLDPTRDPATLSQPIITGRLRGELGYGGVIITDALTMAGVRTRYGDDRVPVLALKAGVDMLLMPPKFDVAYQAVLAAVRGGELTEARIDESVRRILALKSRRGVVARPYVDPDAVAGIVGTPASLARAQEISDRSTTVVKNDTGLLPLAPAGRSILVTGWSNSSLAPVETLAGKLAERGARTTALPTGLPSDELIAQAAASAAQHDLTVVMSSRAWSTGPTGVDTNATQQRLVRALVATGKPVIWVAVRDPYDIAYVTAVPAYLCTYNFTGVGIESLARVLTGQIGPQGKLPVTIPVAGDPNTPLYPFGHGLTW